MTTNQRPAPADPWSDDPAVLAAVRALIEPDAADYGPSCTSCGMPAQPSTLHDTGWACPDGCGAVTDND